MKQGDLMQIMGKDPLSDEDLWEIMRQVVDVSLCFRVLLINLFFF